MSHRLGADAVAVIITAKDAAATAGKAVRSALLQSVVSEVVFVDDGSKDATADVARAACDGSGRLRVLRLDENRGPSFGRNLAIAHSKAPLFCILDADDFMAEDRLARMLEAGGEGWDLLADDMLFLSGPGATVPFDRLLQPGTPLPMDLDLATFIDGNVPRPNRRRRELGFLKPIVRRAFVERHGIGYDERVRLGEDMLYYSQALLKGATFRVVEACGYYAVELPGSLSGRHGTADIAALHTALTETATRAGGAGAAMAPGLRYTRNNLAFREALDSKRAEGWSGFLGAVGRRPASIPYIIRQVARDKLEDAFGKSAR